MARIRTIKPTFWTDEKIGMLSRDARLTFLGMISAMADDQGRLVGTERIVKGAVYPFDDDITSQTVSSHIDDMEALGLIVRYSVNGSAYIHIRTWLRHQKIDRPQKSLLPEPPSIDVDSTNVRRVNHTGAERSGVVAERSSSGDGEGTERKGASNVGKIPPALEPTPNPEPAPPAPLELKAIADELGKDVLDFMGRFYEPAMTETSRQRYRDVLCQLWDAVTPGHPGPKIRGGQRSKARSREHLRETCRLVMADPPNDRDKAVVFVLKRLLDPPKGPTVTERAKEQDEADRASDERFRAERERVARRWLEDPANSNRAAEIAVAVDREFDGQPKSAFLDMARTAALAARYYAAATGSSG